MTDKPARITEQEARDIATSYCHWKSEEFYNAWFSEKGRALLNKLNADREQVPAVAVPDGFGLIPMRNGKPDITDRMKVDCIGEFSWQEEAPYYDENGELHDYVATHVVPWDLCKAIYKRMASVAMLEATPSHSQQSAEGTPA